MITLKVNITYELRLVNDGKFGFKGLILKTYLLHNYII